MLFHINTEFTKLIELRRTKHPNNTYTQQSFPITLLVKRAKHDWFKIVKRKMSILTF